MDEPSWCRSILCQCPLDGLWYTPFHFDGKDRVRPIPSARRRPGSAASSLLKQPLLLLNGCGSIMTRDRSITEENTGSCLAPVDPMMPKRSGPAFGPVLKWTHRLTM